jgi:N-dimethylarginine dimethylaminohydrolase
MLRNTRASIITSHTVVAGHTAKITTRGKNTFLNVLIKIIYTVSTANFNKSSLHLFQNQKIISR